MQKSEIVIMVNENVVKSSNKKNITSSSNSKLVYKKDFIKKKKNKQNFKALLVISLILLCCFCANFYTKTTYSKSAKYVYVEPSLTEYNLNDIQSFRSIENIKKDDAFIMYDLMTCEVKVEDKFTNLVEISYEKVKKENMKKSEVDLSVFDNISLSYKKKEKKNLTEKEINILERLVMAEAESEGIVGQILVANVVFNRIESSGFPCDLESVVFQHSAKGVYQFSCIGDGRYYEVVVSDEVKQAVALAIEGFDFSNSALFYSTVDCKTAGGDWQKNNLTEVLTYKNHVFRK